jgi:hypothetical protein
MARAMRISGDPTQWETVEPALKLMVALAEQERVRQFRGKLKCEGDLDLCGATKLVLFLFREVM